MKYPTPTQVIAWLKSHGWQCVREYDFSADFEKEYAHANMASACVNVPTWAYMDGYSRRLEMAVDCIATHEGRGYTKLAREIAEGEA